MLAKTWKKIGLIILIIAWMILVFYFSNQISDESSKLSGGITRAILNFFNLLEGKTLEQQSAIETIIRKLAHYSIYALGGILILLHVNLYKIKTRHPQWIPCFLVQVTTISGLFMRDTANDCNFDCNFN